MLGIVIFLYSTRLYVENLLEYGRQFYQVIILCPILLEKLWMVNYEWFVRGGTSLYIGSARKGGVFMKA